MALGGGQGSRGPRSLSPSQPIFEHGLELQCKYTLPLEREYSACARFLRTTVCFARLAENRATEGLGPWPCSSDRRYTHRDWGAAEAARSKESLRSDRQREPVESRTEVLITPESAQGRRRPDAFPEKPGDCTHDLGKVSQAPLSSVGIPVQLPNW